MLMQPSEPKPWMLVLNWNGSRRLPISIGALAKMRGDFELLVIDNGSTDGSLAQIETLYPRSFHVLKNGTNLGYAAGNNTGIRFAIEHGATHIALINDDLAVEADWLEDMLASFARNPQIGIIGGLVMFLNRPDFVNSTGLAVDRFFRCPDENFDQALAGLKLQPAEKKAVSGGAMFVRSEVFHKIGELDESYFAYFEDLDFCLRASRYGFGIWFSPTAKSWHLYGGSQAAKNVRRRYLLARNHSWTFSKHAAPWQACLLLPGFFLYRLLVVAPKAFRAEGLQSAKAEIFGAWDGLWGGFQRLGLWQMTKPLQEPRIK